MAQVRPKVQTVLRQIDRMTEEQQCELLEAMLLRQRRSDLGWGTIKRIRATLPRRSEQQVKRDVDVAIQQIRREHSRAVEKKRRQTRRVAQSMRDVLDLYERYEDVRKHGGTSLDELTRKIGAIKQKVKLLERVLPPEMELCLAMEHMARRSRRVSSRVLDRAADRAIQQVRRG